MYELRIGAYKGYDPTTDFIGDNDKRYYWTLEVQSVHYELFEDKSCMPVVYANVIKDELIEEGCNE